jgi:hypothetical protein
MKTNKSGSTRRIMPTNSQNPQTEQKQNKNQIEPTNPWERERDREGWELKDWICCPKI